MDLNEEERSRAYALGKTLEIFGDAITSEIFWLCTGLKHPQRYHADRPGWSEENYSFKVVQRCPHGVPSRVIHTDSLIAARRGVVDDGLACRACDEKTLADARMLFDTLPDAQRAIWAAALRRQVEIRRLEHASAVEETYSYKAESWADRLAVMGEFEAWAERVALPPVPPPERTSDIYVCIERPQIGTHKIRADALSRAHLVRWKDELAGVCRIARGSYTYNDGANVMQQRPEQIHTSLCSCDGVRWDPEQMVDVVEIVRVISTRPDGTLAVRSAADCERADWKFPDDDVCRMVVLEHGVVAVDKSRDRHFND